MKPEHLEMNLILKLALRSFDNFINVKAPPPQFKDNVPNSKNLPTTQTLVPESSDSSDVKTSLDEEETVP